PGGRVWDRRGDAPDRPDDVQLRHAERRDPDRRHRDEESDREARQQVRDGPREHEPAAEPSLEDLGEAPQDDARDEEASEYADDGGEERVQESLGHEALDEVLPPHAEGAGDPHLSLALFGEHDEDVDDQEDARDDREEAE